VAALDCHLDMWEQGQGHLLTIEFSHQNLVVENQVFRRVAALLVVTFSKQFDHVEHTRHDIDVCYQKQTNDWP
jgi:hypothetical protein